MFLSGEGNALDPMKRVLFPTIFLSASLVASSQGAAVLNWVTTNGDAGFSGGSEATNSPVTTDATAETIVGSFPEATLGVGDVMVLTGSFLITGNTGTINGSQIRWGMFDAPATPSTGNGSGYVGVWASASSTISTANGSTGNPFSGSASSPIVTETGGLPAFGTTYDFFLSINRVDATQISVSGSLSNGGIDLISWPETTGPASPASFTYDSVGFLIGGTTNATQAAYSNVDVTVTSIPEPSTFLMGVLGFLGLIRRRR